MTNKEIEAICDERWRRWTERLIEQHSTPLVLLGVGQDSKSGQVTICTLEEMTDGEILLFLEATLRIFKEMIVKKGLYQ